VAEVGPFWNCVDDGWNNNNNNLVIRIFYSTQHGKLVLHVTRQTLLGLG